MVQSDLCIVLYDGQLIYYICNAGGFDQKILVCMTALHFPIFYRPSDVVENNWTNKKIPYLSRDHIFAIWWKS